MLDFRRLEAFSKVYEQRSFSKAGTALFLSQPTISAHVSSLEKDLGVQLFDRLGRTVLPTAAGEILYRHSRDAFTALEKARGEVELLQDKVAGELVVGASTIPSQFLLPDLMASFLATYPDVRFTLCGGDSSSILNRIVDGDLVLGVVGAREEHPDLAFKPVLKDELVVIAPTDMVEAGATYDMAQVADLPWVMREAGSGTRRAFANGLEDMGMDVRALRCVAEVETTQAALQCVRAGMGLTVTSRLASESFRCMGGVTEIRMRGFEMHRSFYCVYHSRRHLFPAVRYFIDHMLHSAVVAAQAWA
ncbi:MAG: selenium metabolism-associated LysR family transcriptional regulator [Desulfovibrionaceae bacterium]